MLRTMWMVALGLLVGGAAVCDAAVIAIWNYDSGAANGTAFSGATPYGANTLNSGGSFLTSASEALTSVGGQTTLRAGTGNGGGIAVEYIAPSHGDQINANTMTFTLTASVAINSTFSLSYDSKFSGGTPTDTWTYSVNGGAFLALSTVSTADATFTTHSMTTALASLSAGQTIVFRDTISGLAIGSSPTLDFDNVVVAVPEPTNWALAFFGFGFVGLLIWQNRKQKAA